MKRMSALILLLMLLLCSCAAPVAPEAPELLEPVQAQLQTATVLRGDLMDATIEYGNIFIASQPVAFSIDGTVETVHVIPGQSVKQGDILAELNTESLQAQLDALLQQQAATSYSNALTNRNLEIDAEICQLNLDALISSHQEQMAALQQQEADLCAALDLLTQENTAKLAVLEQELQTLTDADAITEKKAQIDEKKLAYSQAEATLAAQIDTLTSQISAASLKNSKLEALYQLDLEEAELALKHAKQTQYRASLPVTAKIEELQAQLDQAVITAPADGIISWISTSSRATADKAYLYLSDPTQVALRTMQQSSHDMRSAENIYALIGGEEYPLTFQEPDPTADSLKSMNNILLTSIFHFAPGAEIPENSNALVFFVHQSRKDVLILPLSTLSQDQNGYYVYKLTDGVQEKVYVKIGLKTAMNAEIVSGLEEGDVVHVAS